jgi:hypothetical protein
MYRPFQFALTALLCLALTGCPHRQDSKQSTPQLVIPRECMGKATFSKGQCQPISATKSRCIGVDMDVETLCVKVAK